MRIQLISRVFPLIAGLLLLASCGEYQKALKSPDPNYKFEFAKRAFEEKKYVQAYTLLQDVVTQLKGSDKAEESMYLLGLSYYENKEYPDAAAYFKAYYQRYPKGKYTELARYYAGYAYYLDSPEPQLDQSETIKAIEELQGFLLFHLHRATGTSRAIILHQEAHVWSIMPLLTTTKAIPTAADNPFHYNKNIELACVVINLQLRHRLTH